MAAKKTASKKTSTRKRPASRQKPESGSERFMRLAASQMRRCCIPTAVAITTSVVISNIGAPIVPVALVGVGGYAWWRGYRIRVVKPGEDT